MTTNTQPARSLRGARIAIGIILTVIFLAFVVNTYLGTALAGTFMWVLFLGVLVAVVVAAMANRRRG
jgi:hypothetical protein